MHDQRAAEHDRDGQAEGELQGLIDPVFPPGAVVVSQNGDQAVVEPEDRHKEETLELEIYTEDGSRCRGESGKDHVHAVGHDGSDRHHQDGGHADSIDPADGVPVGMKDPFPAQMYVGVEFQIHEQAEQGCDALSQNSGVSGARDAEPWKSEETEDHDRVEDDIDDRPCSLTDHAQLCAAGGLKEPLKGQLEEETERESGHGREIGVPILNNLCSGSRV